MTISKQKLYIYNIKCNYVIYIKYECIVKINVCLLMCSSGVAREGKGKSFPPPRNPGKICKGWGTIKASVGNKNR